MLKHVGQPMNWIYIVQFFAETLSTARSVMINLLFFAYSRYMGILQNDVDLIHEIEAVVGKQLEEFECKEQEVLSDITRVRHLEYDLITDHLMRILIWKD